MPSEVPEGWQQSKIDAHVEALRAGVSVNSENRPRSEGEIGILKTSCLSGGVFSPHQHKTVLPDEQERVTVRPKADSIIVSRMNTPALVGESAYVARDYPYLFLPDRLWRVDLCEPHTTDPQWLSYLLSSRSARNELGVRASGTSGSMKNLSKAAFLGMPLLLPPLPEQKKIAAILSSVDDAIQATQAVIEQTRRVKEGLLQDLLTRGIGHTRFKQTEIGEIPESWEVRRLGEVITLQRGFDITQAQAESGDYPVVTSSGVSYHHSDFKVDPPGVVTGRKGKLGAVYLLQEPFWPHDTTLWVSEFNGSHAPFVRWLLVSLDLSSLDAATSVPTLNRNNAHRLKVAVPSQLHEQEAIATRLAEFERLEAQHRATLTAHEVAKAGLLQDLLTGKVRVSV